MNRRSAFLKIALGFIAIYSLYTAAFFIYWVDDAYQKMNQHTFEVASNYLKMGRILLANDEPIDLAERLAAGLKTAEVDYYLIRQNGVTLAQATAAGTGDFVPFLENPDEGMYETENYRHFVILENGYELTIGYKPSVAAYVERAFRQNRELILKDIGFVSFLVLLLVLYNFRDLRLILRNLSRKGSQRGDQSLAVSSEVLTLVQGLKGYESKITALTHENQILKGQVLPALQNELDSGIKPPYEFHCTMVRTDINNFTTLFSTQNRDEFMGVINEFFIGVTHIVSRYKGYVYEFVGDEVIYYFKDSEHENSSLIAISAMRDINALAEEMSDKTEAQYGYLFRIKSSFSYGVIRFGPQVNGFSLAGNPLIESVRILSHVHEKSENTVLFDETVNDRIAAFCVTKELRVVMLKGLANARRLFTYQAHIPLSHHLRQGTEEHFAQTTYYRSDKDISEILDFIRINRKTLPQERIIQLLTLFKSYRVTTVGVEVKASYVALLEALLHDASQIEDGKSVFALASAVASALSLFTKASFKGRVRELLLDCLKAPERRIVANAIDVFAELEPESAEKIFDTLTQHSDNRIAANMLIKRGKSHWDKTLAKRLRKMINAPSPYFKASGLYALGEIALHLKKDDEVAFLANRDLQRLLEDIPARVVHANRMVRRQALQAALKSDRLSDLYQIETYHRSSMTDEIRSEIRSFLASHEELSHSGKATLSRVA